MTAIQAERARAAGARGPRPDRTGQHRQRSGCPSAFRWSRSSTRRSGRCRRWCCARRASWPTRSRSRSAAWRARRQHQGRDPVRWRRAAQPDPEPGAWRACRGRHAGPHPRPPRARPPETGCRAHAWCSTRPTACSTWASSTTSPRSPSSARRSARPCCSRPPIRKGGPSRGQFMREPQTVRSRASMHRQDPPAFLRGEEQRAAVGGRATAEPFPPEKTLAFCNTAAMPRPGHAAARARLRGAGALWRNSTSASATRCWCSSPTAAARCWWRPTSRRAAFDIAQLDAVINVDCTPDPRSTSTASAAPAAARTEGLALTLASLDEMGAVGKIEQLQGREVAWQPLEAWPRPRRGRCVRRWRRCRSWAGAGGRSAPAMCWAR